MQKNSKGKALFFLIIVLTFAADQLSKLWIDVHMAEGQTIPFISGIFDITYIHNTGAAFGIFEGKTWLLFTLTGLLMLGLSVYVIINRDKLSVLEKSSIALIVSGGLGNIVTRAIYGFVIDFFNFYFWPVFNVADIFICIGCGLLVIYVLFFDNTEDGKR